jgi:hypothetical protein
MSSSTVLLVSLLTAAPAALPTRAEQRSAVTYDVRDLLARPGKTGYSSVEALLKIVLTSVNPGGWNAEGGDAVHEVNGSALEVRAPAARQAQVKQVLDALRRAADLAVDLRGDLYEVDRAFYDREVKPKLRAAAAGGELRLAGVVPAELAQRLAKQGRLVKFAQERLAVGRESPFLSWHRATTYLARPGRDAKAAESLEVVLTGVAVRAAAAVSADRRQVVLKLTQQVTDLLALQKQPRAGAEGGQPRFVELPDLARSVTAETVQAEDGEPVLLPVHYLPREARDKKRVLVLLVRPTIVLEAEEKARRKIDTQ